MPGSRLPFSGLLKMLVAVVVGVAGVGLSSIFVFRMIRSVLGSISSRSDGIPVPCVDIQPDTRCTGRALVVDREERTNQNKEERTNQNKEERTNQNREERINQNKEERTNQNREERTNQNKEERTNQNREERTNQNTEVFVRGDTSPQRVGRVSTQKEIKREGAVGGEQNMLSVSDPAVEYNHESSTTGLSDLAVEYNHESSTTGLLHAPFFSSSSFPQCQTNSDHTAWCNTARDIVRKRKFGTTTSNAPSSPEVNHTANDAEQLCSYNNQVVMHASVPCHSLNTSNVDKYIDTTTSSSRCSIRVEVEPLESSQVESMQSISAERRVEGLVEDGLGEESKSASKDVSSLSVNIDVIFSNDLSRSEQRSLSIGSGSSSFRHSTPDDRERLLSELETSGGQYKLFEYNRELNDSDRLWLDTPPVAERSRSLCCQTAPVMNQCQLSLSMSTASILNDYTAIDFDNPLLTPSHHHHAMFSGSWTPMILSSDLSSHDESCDGTSLYHCCSDHRILGFESSLIDVDLKSEAVPKLELMETELQHIHTEILELTTRVQLLSSHDAKHCSDLVTNSSSHQRAGEHNIMESYEFLSNNNIFSKHDDYAFQSQENYSYTSQLNVDTSEVPSYDHSISDVPIPDRSSNTNCFWSNITSGIDLNSGSTPPLLASSLASLSRGEVEDILGSSLDDLVWSSLLSANIITSCSSSQ